MNGLQRIVRRNVLERLKGNAGVVALVPPASIYGQTTPAADKLTYPFIKTGVPQTLPIVATCLRGGQVTLPVDAFAGPRRNVAGQVVEYAEDHASRIGEAIENAIHLTGVQVTIDGALVRIRYTLGDMRLFRDGAEQDVYHYSCLVNARVLAE